MIDRPSEKEQEYFIRQDLERIKAMRDEHLLKQKEAERAKLKEIHFMHCAKCGQVMTTINLTGVDVELCSGCGGMYLDQGELAKLTEKNKRGALSAAIESARRIWKEIS
jgi:formylmethanofuran dehydrogenase subunit E